MIREKQQDLGRDTPRRPTRQTDTDKTQRESDCRTHSHATLNGKFLITRDGWEPGGGRKGLGGRLQSTAGEGGGVLRKGWLPGAPALALSSVRGRCGAASADSPPHRFGSSRRPAVLETPIALLAKSRCVLARFQFG